jgi:hypothetical protein
MDRLMIGWPFALEPWYRHDGDGIVQAESVTYAVAEQQAMAEALGACDPAAWYTYREWRCAGCGHAVEYHGRPFALPEQCAGSVGCSCAGGWWASSDVVSVQIVGTCLPLGQLLVWDGQTTRRIGLATLFADYVPVGAG